jgi:hypothetical protein
MLVDDTPNRAFTKGMAERLRAALERDGASLTWTSVLEATDPGVTGSHYPGRAAVALKSNPDLVYVSDHGFVAKATLAEAQRCVFSGVPAATEMPSAKTYARQYRATFRKTPRVWGSFTYDSARILFAAIDGAKSHGFAAVERQLRATKGYWGATAAIRINRRPVAGRTLLSASFGSTTGNGS